MAKFQTYIEEIMTLMDNNWKVPTAVCWGQRDRWLSYDGVEDFCKDLKHQLIQLPMAGHHVQEDSGEELGQLVDLLTKDVLYDMSSIFITAALLCFLQST